MGKGGFLVFLEHRSSQCPAKPTPTSICCNQIQFDIKYLLAIAFFFKNVDRRAIQQIAIASRQFCGNLIVAGAVFRDVFTSPGASDIPALVLQSTLYQLNFSIKFGFQSL
jgi:hypothetical protein